MNSFLTREIPHNSMLYSKDYRYRSFEQEFAIRGKQKGSVREETNAVTRSKVMNVQNRHRKRLHPLNHPHKEVEVRRGKRASEAGVHLGSSLPECQFC